MDILNRESINSDGSDVHAAVFNSSTGAEKMVICPGFWTGIARVTPPTCENIGSIVSHMMRFPAGTILHEFLYV